jgi:Methyltransferase domain
LLTGYFSRQFAKQVARVYAEDIDPEALDFLRKEAISNVNVIPGKPENPMLPANSCNLVFICDVLHLVRNRPAFSGSIVGAGRGGCRNRLLEKRGSGRAASTDETN